MNYYSYAQNRYRNRAERRKNGIKSEKKTYPKWKGSIEELERIVRKELDALINEPCSETIKKEKYRRLEPLIEEYKRQKENSSTVPNRTRQAINAYQEQMNFVPKAKMVNKKAEKAKKKGFFRRILDAFNPQPVAPKKTLRKPEPAKIQKTYHHVTQKVQQIKQVRDDIYNEFEKQLRNFQNYSQNTIGYQYYKNGRQIKYEPRCL